MVRIVSDDLTERMTEWVTLQVLMHHRQQRRYDRLQRERCWHELPQPAASEASSAPASFAGSPSVAGRALSRAG